MFNFIKPCFRQGVTSSDQATGDARCLGEVTPRDERGGGEEENSETLNVEDAGYRDEVQVLVENYFNHKREINITLLQVLQERRQKLSGMFIVALSLQSEISRRSCSTKVSYRTLYRF